MFANGKPKAAAACLSAAGKICTVKSFKNTGQMFFRYTVPVITYFYQHIFPVHIVKTCFNTAGFFSVFDCIFCKVNKYLPYFFLIRINRKRKLTTFFYKATDVPFLSSKVQGFKHVFYEVLYNKLLPVKLHFPAFQPGYFIEVI